MNAIDRQPDRLRNCVAVLGLAGRIEAIQGRVDFIGNRCAAIPPKVDAQTGAVRIEHIAFFAMLPAKKYSKAVIVCRV